MTPSFDDLVRRRLILNLLIQGAGEYHMMDAHRSVGHELRRVRRGLCTLYAVAGPAMSLMQWYLDAFLVVGLPSRFWARTREADHPFHGHPLLREHGGRLSRLGKARAARRAIRFGVVAVPLIYHAQAVVLLIVTALAEIGIRRPLTDLAKEVVEREWGFDRERMRCGFAFDCKVGGSPIVTNTISSLMAEGASGWCTVERLADGRLGVRAKAWYWALLVHELTKGVVELVCLPALSEVDDETYRRVIEETDQLDKEPWLLQAGMGLYGLLVDVMEDAHPKASYLHQLATLPTAELEEIAFALIESPSKARRLLGDLMDGYVEPEPY